MADSLVGIKLDLALSQGKVRKHKELICLLQDRLVSLQLELCRSPSTPPSEQLTKAMEEFGTDNEMEQSDLDPFKSLKKQLSLSQGRVGQHVLLILLLKERLVAVELDLGRSPSTPPSEELTKAMEEFEANQKSPN